MHSIFVWFFVFSTVILWFIHAVYISHLFLFIAGYYSIAWIYLPLFAYPLILRRLDISVVSSLGLLQIKLLWIFVSKIEYLTVKKKSLPASPVWYLTSLNRHVFSYQNGKAGTSLAGQRLRHHLPVQRMQGLSLLRELRSQPKSKNMSNMVTNSTKTLKTVHIKTKIFFFQKKKDKTHPPPQLSRKLVNKSCENVFFFLQRTVYIWY